MDIFNLISTGKISDGAALMLFCLEKYGTLKTIDLAKMLHKSAWTISNRYYKELSAISVVVRKKGCYQLAEMQHSSKLVSINKLNKKINNTNKQTKSVPSCVNATNSEFASLQNEVAKALDELGKPALLDVIINDVQRVIARNPAYPFNPEVLKAIIQYVYNMQKKTRIHDIFAYMRTCLNAMWVPKSAELKILNNQTPVNVTNQEPHEEQASPVDLDNLNVSPMAKSIWNHVISDAKTAGMKALDIVHIRGAMPLFLTNNVLTVWLKSTSLASQFTRFKKFVEDTLQMYGINLNLVVQEQLPLNV